MTYKEIIKIIKNISLALPDVESFYTGDVYEINKDQSVKYGSVVLTNQEHSFDNVNDQFNYNFVLFYIDRLTDDEANRIDVQTAGINALTTIVKTIEDYGCIIDNVRYNVFKERFNDWCSGVYGTFSIQVDDNDCVEEFEIITPEKLKAITINSNGTYKGLFNEVNVQVPDKEFLTETKSIDIAENGTYSVEKSDNVDGMSAVEINVNVPQPTFTTEELSVTANGTYTPTTDGFSKVSVNVPTPEPNLQVKTISITENGTQTINADNGYDGLQSVSITTNVSGGTSDKIMLTDGTKFGGTYNFNGTLYDTSSMTDFGNMFYPCYTLTSLDLSSWDTSSVIDMTGMFQGCKALTSLDISNWNTSSVTKMRGVFFNCSSLTSLDLSGWDTSAVTIMEQMFQGCSSLTSLDLSNFDTSQVTDFGYMFNNCYALTSLNLSSWNTSSVTNLHDMFYYCSGLTSLNLSNWNTSSVTNTSGIFSNCTVLTSLDVSGWDMSSVTEMNGMFRDCNALEIINMDNVKLPKRNLSVWGLSNCTKLTVGSLVGILNALPQLDEGQSLPCSIGATNLAKLSDTEKAIATNKNWRLV